VQICDALRNPELRLSQRHHERRQLHDPCWQ
jgi:hypothetical protein